jgi:hypothetical protein
LDPASPPTRRWPTAKRWNAGTHLTGHGSTGSIEGLMMMMIIINTIITIISNIPKLEVGSEVYKCHPLSNNCWSYSDISMSKSYKP